MKTLDDLFYEVEHLCVSFFKDWEVCTAAELGLDPRAYYGTLYYSRDGIAIKGNTRSLDYYGGFEYVEGDDRKEIGSWTVYLSSSERVRRHLEQVLLDPEEARDILE